MSSAVHPLTYEDWNRILRWETRRDAKLRFDSAVLEEALARWRSLGGSDYIPHHSKVTLRALNALAGWTVIIERTAGFPSAYRVRHMGHHLTQVLGPMHGKALAATLPEGACERWKIFLDAVLAECRPLRLVSRMALRTLDHFEAEILMAPLCDANGQPTLVFGAAVFTAGVARDDEAWRILGG
ncbi:MAG: PAS domain-containing protein [Alphaproteobacteria bacterium]|nr:PAS domain-containing protein [Alphaproteobacteria bacterium]